MGERRSGGTILGAASPASMRGPHNGQNLAWSWQDDLEHRACVQLPQGNFAFAMGLSNVLVDDVPAF